jgi:hypothetical protein
MVSQIPAFGGRKMVDSGKRIDYCFSAVNELVVQTTQDKRTGQPVVSAVLVGGEPLIPTERFWTSLYAKFGFNGSIFRYFRHQEVLERIAQTETDRLRLCIERDQAGGKNRLLAVSSPGKPIVRYDDLMDTITRYGGEGVCYADGIVESTHVPRAGCGSFQIAGDEFSNRFLLAAPIDGYGLPNVYLSLLRHVCTNGAVGYAKEFRSSLAIGRGNDDVIYSIVRALEGFSNDEGFAALRQRFEMAARSWASVYEAQGLYKHLVRLLAGRHVGGDGAALAGSGSIARLLQAADSPEQRPTSAALDEIGSPMITAFTRLVGDPASVYGLANLDALSVKRQRTLPTKAKVYDLLNFVSEIGTHHTDEYGARSSQAWLGSLISNEFDLENSCSVFGSFQEYFLDRKLDGETALELQRVGR